MTTNEQGLTLFDPWLQVYWPASLLQAWLQLGHNWLQEGLMIGLQIELLPVSWLQNEYLPTSLTHLNHKKLGWDWNPYD
jgi:hypothetical protein